MAAESPTSDQRKGYPRTDDGRWLVMPMVPARLRGLVPDMSRTDEMAPSTRPEAVARRLVERIEALEVAGRLERAIRAKDTAAILEFVAADGILCGDGKTPKAHVKGDLQDHESWLCAYPFDAARFNAKYAKSYGRPSPAEFFARGTAITSRVKFAGREWGVDTPCVELRAANMDAVPFFCFVRSGKRWFLTGSLYPCG